MTTQPLDLLLQGQQRNDMLMPLLQGRANIEGATLRPAPGPVDYFGDPRYRNGEFDLLDQNWGDILPTLDAGWDVKLLPVFTKKKLAYNYLWVRADRGIDTPKDLEGKTFATGFYEGAVANYTRGLLKHFHGVDISTFKWLVVTPQRHNFPVSVPLEYAAGPRKGHVARLLDGEVDAITSDITASADWAALESSPLVKRMFPDYRERNVQLYREHGICTPAHLILIGGQTLRANPGLGRRVYEAFDRSRELAYEDLLGDQPNLSANLFSRETMQEQQRTWGGDPWKGGMAANRANIEAFLDYAYEGGVTGKRIKAEDIFAADCLDT